ncbi:MAG: SufS family cysteine desulfurase [Candidatus Omnitrophica bacterium]|nr:SufS family cysteine desulfurase [Candidatus Omnitrophota bacterium]
MLDVEKIRKDFPILEEKVNGRPLVYLDNAATTHKPRPVLDRMMEFYARSNSNIHRGVHDLSRKASTAYEEAREEVRKFIGARDIGEIIFTRGTTDGINLVAGAFGESCLNAGDEVIVTEMEHHSNLIPWQKVCARKNAVLRVLPFDDEGRLKIDDLDRLISERTRILAVSYVSNALGVINPVRDIIRRAHSRDVPVLVDGAQAVQHMRVDVGELDCDFFVFSGHKMYAATGTGVLYGKRKWLEKLDPYQYGGGMVSSAGLDECEYEALPLKFEAGTGSLGAVISLKAAIEYIGGTGMSLINDHETRLSELLTDRLRQIRGITLYGPLTERCGVVSFNIDGAHPYDAGVLLDKLGIAVRTGTHCAEPIMRHYRIPGTIRASIGLYNTENEINDLTDGIKKIRAML